LQLVRVLRPHPVPQLLDRSRTASTVLLEHLEQCLRPLQPPAIIVVADAPGWLSQACLSLRDLSLRCLSRHDFPSHPWRFRRKLIPIV
jgi:hypothetical protein